MLRTFFHFISSINWYLLSSCVYIYYFSFICRRNTVCDSERLLYERIHKMVNNCVVLYFLFVGFAESTDRWLTMATPIVFCIAFSYARPIDNIANYENCGRKSDCLNARFSTGMCHYSIILLRNKSNELKVWEFFL